MTPLLVVTKGYIPCRTTLKLATRGFIGICGSIATIADIEMRLRLSDTIMYMVRQVISVALKKVNIEQSMARVHNPEMNINKLDIALSVNQKEIEIKLI